MVAKKTSSNAVVSAGVKNLTVTSGKNAKLDSLITDIRRAIGRTACKACRSGIDRIIFEERVIKKR